MLTAKCERSLKNYIPSFLEYLDTVAETPTFAQDLSYTLGQRRTHLAYRVAAVGSSAAELKARLSVERVHRVQKRTIGFIFPGQGAQYVFKPLQRTQRWMLISLTLADTQKWPTIWDISLCFPAL